MPVAEFLRAQDSLVFESVCSDDDALCSAALVTMAKAVEHYGLFLTPEVLPDFVAYLLSLLSQRDAVASAAILCLTSITEHWLISSPDYPLALRVSHMQLLWDTVAGPVSQVPVIESAYLLLEHFVADLPDLDPHQLIAFLEHSVEVFKTTPGQDDSGSDRNSALRTCSLDLLTSILRAGGSRLRIQAAGTIRFVLSEITSLHLSPIEDFLTVLLAAVEQLKCATAVFLGQLVPLAVAVLETWSFTALEPAFELLATLCCLLPCEMAAGLPTLPDFITPCLEPGRFPSSSHPAALRAFASLFQAFPLTLSTEICEGFRGVCTAACEAAFKVDQGHDPETKGVEDMDALAEAVIRGFTALIYIQSENQDVLTQYTREWTDAAEALVVRRPPPISEHLLDAYFSFLEAIIEYSPCWGSPEICGALDLMPLSWGISSDNEELLSRGRSLWDIVREWRETHA
jgi:hypothetical protein